MRFSNDSRRARTVLALMAGLALLAGSLLGGTGPAEPDNVRFASRLPDRPPRFTVELRLDEAGITGYFTEVSGLGSENEIVEFRDGSDQNIIRKLPGRLKYSDITLKRGVIRDGSLWQWRRLVETGNVADARTHGSIALLDRGSPVASWQFVNAWPAKITGPELKGDGNDIAIEEIVIAHEGMTRE